MSAKDHAHSTTRSSARGRSRTACAIRVTDEALSACMGSQPTSARFDNTMVGLSSLADRGKLWAAVGAALTITGHRAAAARGMASVVIASATANLIGKRVFGGTRPPLSRVPLGRQLEQSPTSATFPSGHTASAFAFAVGASITNRRLAVVLVPLAVAVAYSRLHTGAHWLSDVVGGALLGTSAAALDAALHHGRRNRGRSAGARR